jgi:hypothetical protein
MQVRRPGETPLDMHTSQNICMQYMNERPRCLNLRIENLGKPVAELSKALF